MHTRGRLVAWLLDLLALASVLVGVAVIVQSSQRETTSSLTTLSREIGSALSAVSFDLDRLASRVPGVIVSVDEIADAGDGLAVVVHDLGSAVAAGVPIAEQTASLIEAMRDEAASAAKVADVIPPSDPPGDDQVGQRLGVLAETVHRSLDAYRRAADVLLAYQQTTHESAAAIRDVGRELSLLQDTLISGARSARALQAAVDAVDVATPLRWAAYGVGALAILVGVFLFALATLVRAAIPAADAQRATRPFRRGPAAVPTHA